MLITKTVKAVWNNGSKKYYEGKGYVWTERDDVFEVDIKDLPNGSHILVEVKCDYCGKVSNISYRDYAKSLNANKYVQKYCCENCDHEKKRETLNIKQSLGILKRNDKGYWTFKENRIKEFVDFIKKNGSVDNMQYIDSPLYSAITAYEKKQPPEFAKELGYDIIKISKLHKSYNYDDNIEALISDIKQIILELGRFPKQQEILKTLKIGNDRLLKHGGIDKIREIMGYNDENLIDDSGFKNKSVYEYIVAQYLIHYTNISYNREEYPFKEYGKEVRNYRSDFNFVTYDGTEVHVEMWGAPKNDHSSSRASAYNKKRKVKEELYKKYNIELISLNCENFILKHNKDIHEYLDEKFKEYNNNCIFKEFDLKIYLPCKSMSDEEILQEILIFSTKKGLFPKSEELFRQKRACLYYECIKRYGSYDNFAKKFNYKTHYTVWKMENIIYTFDYMVKKYDYILKNFEMRTEVNNDVMFKGFSDGVKKFFKNYIDAVIYYCEYCIEKGLINNLCNYKTINYLKQIAGILSSNMNNTYRSDIAKNKAKNIIYIIEENLKESV